MKAPPPELDGARVRFWSPLDSRHRKTEKIRLYSDGHEQTSFEGLAIATYEKKSSGAYVFFCDANWSVVNDSLYRDIEEAKRAAEAQVEGVAFTWTEVCEAGPSRHFDPTRVSRPANREGFRGLTLSAGWISFGVRQEMIDWRISPDFEAVKGRDWFFPNFEVQEFLLPQINVGKKFIDPYGDTIFTTEDCARLKGNVEYLMDFGGFDTRREIRFDSLEKGLVTLSCDQIQNCLLRLHKAAEEALKRDGTLAFYGD